ncbi:hypothetical protein MT355_20320 [Rathayibacter sp. VKM Ac-2929]|uniref:hypothetical protein n=1 Tax=Rathayibacter sp. VKM Ac-2929 TaxID=2929480 RepID=UPI001FB3B052|nr:hypothetical protein [Rathayibacter sp. VKM Ac-2929]MCJ1675618.1 hypothetical protein [Rathayibacter sp. VKM Ac-2929]
MTRRHRALRPRTLRRHLRTLLERCQHFLRIDVPSSSDESSQPLRLQDSAERSVPIVQSVFDAGSVTKGQTVVVDGHRAMTVELENGRITLVPVQLNPNGSLDPAR